CLRRLAAKWGLPPVTFTRLEGWQLSEDPAVWIAYERALFDAELRHVTRALEEVMRPHAKRAPGDDWVRLVLDQLGGIRASLEVIIRLER
ncbi:RacP protein, partial [Streptomyces olivoreticuli]